MRELVGLRLVKVHQPKGKFVLDKRYRQRCLVCLQCNRQCLRMNFNGPIVQWQNASFATKRPAFDSRRVHQLNGPIVQWQNTSTALRRLRSVTGHVHDLRYNNKTPSSSSGQDTRFSSQEQEFDSPWRCHQIGCLAGRSLLKNTITNIRKRILFRNAKHM